jgi:hypothetical protein
MRYNCRYRAIIRVCRRMVMLVGGSLFIALLACSDGNHDSPTPNQRSSELGSVTIPGAVIDGTETSPIAQARCRLVDFDGNAILDDEAQAITAAADESGQFELLGVPLAIEGFIECHPEQLPNMVLSAYTSTKSAHEGQVLDTEIVEPATSLVSDILRQFRNQDPLGESVPDLTDLENGCRTAISQGSEAGIKLLADGAVLVYNTMLDASIDDIAFTNRGNSQPYGALEDLSTDGHLDRTPWQPYPFIKSLIDDEAARLKQAAGLGFAEASGTGSIQGRVVDGQGNPLVDRDIFTAGFAQVTETDLNGEFLLANLPAGPLTLFVQGFGQVATLGVIGAAVAPAEITIRTGSIRGRVTDQTTAAHPLADQTVIALRDDEPVGRSAVSDAAGFFVLNGIPVGEIVVTFFQPPPTNYQSDTVTVVENQQAQAHLVIFMAP